MFTIEIAGVPIAVRNRYPFVEWNCKGFLTEKQPLFSVSASEEEIRKENRSVTFAEQQCVFRRIAMEMIEYDAFIMHAAVISIDGEGLAFAAGSGTGKTTRALMWSRELEGRVKIVNGDKPMLRFTDGGLFAFGTPWMGKERLGENACVPLRYVCFLERSEDPSLIRLTVEEAAPRIFRQVLLPRDERKLGRFMRLMERFAGETPFFLLKCNREKERPVEIWEEMKEKARGTRIREG